MIKNRTDKILKTRSYTAASSVPIKTALNDQVKSSIEKFGIIPPVHIQMNPTNVCNLNCDFCSCAGRRKNESIPIDTAQEIIEYFAECGTKAVTITGGGEPLLYKNINELLAIFISHNIKIGLVTNGTQFTAVMPRILNDLTWCRISHSDKRVFDTNYYQYLHSVVTNAPSVDWAFSVVVSGESLYTCATAVEFANEHNFTHVRIVPDLYNVNDIELDNYRFYLAECGIDDSLVIYQERNNATPGGDCYICYLKPYIDADGKIYTCCGAQYALPGDYRCMPPELCLGTIDEYVSKSLTCKPFKGEICETCYYMGYNELLKSMLNKLDHEEFL